MNFKSLITQIQKKKKFNQGLSQKQKRNSGKHGTLYLQHMKGKVDLANKTKTSHQPETHPNDPNCHL